MARSSNSIEPFVFDITDVPFEKVEELPWKDLEAIAGTKFSQRAMGEIFSAYTAYHWKLCARKQAGEVKDSKSLRRDILKHASALHSIYIESARGETAGPAKTLGRLYDKAGSVNDLLWQVGPLCHELVLLLAPEPEPEEGEVSAKGNGALALAEYVKSVVHGAESKPARREPGYNKNAKSLEYRRWGISVGPTIGQFKKFSAALLDRKCSEQQLREAFEAAGAADDDTT